MSLLQAVTSAFTPAPREIARPHLDLSGPRLTQAFEALVAGSEALGGIERYVAALQLKNTLFQSALLECEGRTLVLETFKGLCPFMASVRRRIAPYLGEDKFPRLRDALGELLAGAADTAATNARIENFCAHFPRDKAHRWVSDLAAEVLHNTYPERYPLMCRWVWDRKANTGVLREIWFAADLDHITIDVPSDYGTFLMLREELTQFLTHNGVFSDVLIYTDLVCAQVYADYICAQGGSYLRADFSSPDDPMQHARRLLGLDGVRAGSGRTRLKAIDGESYVIEDDQPLLG
jgi:hypothetical protein